MSNEKQMREALQAVIAAHDAEMKDLGERMRAADLKTLRVDIQAAIDTFAAIEQARQALALPITPPAAATAPAVPQCVHNKIKCIKVDLMHQRRFGADSLQGWRGACTSAEGDIEDVLKLIAAAAPAPAVPQDSDPTSKEQYRRMFVAACEALGAISDALGCDPEDGGAEPILGALEELQISLGLSNGILGCLSAAQALQEGEPVMWVMRAHETGQLEPARPHQKAKHPKIWSDAFPLYVAPSQPVTLTDELDKLDVKVSAGLCQVTADGKHAYLREIQAIIAALRAKGALR